MTNQKCQQCKGKQKFIFWFGHKKGEYFCSGECQDKATKKIEEKENE